MTTPTCEYRRSPEDFCLGPVAVIVRWRYRGDDEHQYGGLCEGHWAVGVAQVAADAEVDLSTLEMMRM